MNANDLKRWRKKKCLSQSEAAQMLKIKLDTWRKWEQGINPIPDIIELAMKGLEIE